MAQMVKNLPAVWETWVQSLRWEDLLEESMVTYSSILAWRVYMDRGIWWATVHGLQRVGHDLVTKNSWGVIFADYIDLHLWLQRT